MAQLVECWTVDREVRVQFFQLRNLASCEPSFFQVNQQAYEYDQEVKKRCENGLRLSDVTRGGAGEGDGRLGPGAKFILALPLNTTHYT